VSDRDCPSERLRQLRRTAPPVTSTTGSAAAL